jgi:hypothetical protein
MATVKALIKITADAIKQQKWDTAIQSCHAILQRDPKHYQA